MSGVWPWAALAGLGALHGVNPAMGWLFAVAIGLQRKSRAAIAWSLLPIAVGHAASIALVVVAVVALRPWIDYGTLRLGAAVALIAFGVFRLVARHRARIGMQVSGGDLALWSFLMATAHGAGLMLLPVLLSMPLGMPSDTQMHMPVAGMLGQSAATGVAAVAVHTVAMLCVAGAIAFVVYEWLGLAFLRRAWINFDRVWALLLIGAGVLLLIVAWP
jgi:hypothetical protein